MFGRKGLHHLGLQSLLQWGVHAWCLSEALVAFELFYWLPWGRPSSVSLTHGRYLLDTPV